MTSYDDTIPSYDELPAVWQIMGTDPVIETVNPFLMPDSYYVRDLNMVGSAVSQAALYLSKRTGDSIEKCLTFIKEEMKPDGKFPYKDPRIQYLDSTNEGNRTLKEGTMSEFLLEVTEKKYTLAANLTAYNHPDDKESFTAMYAVGEYANRKANKDKQHHYDLLGDSVMKGIYNNRQNRNKIKLNSISGAHNTTSSALFCRSTHSTLTSTTRCGTSNTNAMLERLLAGNRHYYNLNAVLNNITSIIYLVDLELVQKAMDEYGLVYPTTDDCFNVIKRSTDLYWQCKDTSAETEIRALLDALTPVERAAYLYNCDMHSLRTLNDTFVRRLFKSLLTIPDKTRIPFKGDWIKRLSGDDKAFISVNAFNVLTTSNLKESTDEDKEIVDASGYGIYATFTYFATFFQAFWVTKAMPFEIASFPDSIRRVSIASDTDSAIFTNQDWVEWYFGKMNFGHEGLCMAAATTYLCSQVAQHVLVQMTRNFGCADRHIREFQMKNEFLFKFFSLTTMAKHYFAAKHTCEGIVYDVPDWEIKGSNLKNTKATSELMERSDGLIKEIAHKVMAGEKIQLIPILKEIADKETEIINSIRSGSTEFFATGQIKDFNSYKQKENAPAWHNYLLWLEVFAPKYGQTPPPAYTAIKVNIECDTGGKMKAWFDDMPDQELATRFREFMIRYKKTAMTAIWLPSDHVGAHGMPDEIMMVVNVRKMIIGMMKSYYLILESLGFHILNSNDTRLISDDLAGFTKKAA